MSGNGHRNSSDVSGITSTQRSVLPSDIPTADTESLEDNNTATTGTANASINSDANTGINTSTGSQAETQNHNEPPHKTDTPSASGARGSTSTSSTYEIDGITYQYGVAYPNRPMPKGDDQQQQGPKLGMHPNMMSYLDSAGVNHEIHIPTGNFHRAVQLYRDENWDELGRFPAYAGQKYTEADYYTLDDSDDQGDNEENQDGAQKCPCGGYW